ncbi:hypothetical protein M8J75_007941 [Diaphorina citri]|nr:hypothetical protein M8J75_007941 [Diaphorina citri]
MDTTLEPGLDNHFTIPDYIVLLTMLVVSCAIGFFVGMCGEKQTTSDDFLLGSSSMGTLPMALSLAASFITAIELLGNPSEFYNHGSQFFLICISFVLVVPLTSRLYLPVFMKLRLTSAYEYLEMRFDSKVRVMASALYIIQMVFYTSVAVFAPALALSHVTGLNTYLAVTMVYCVCIFYASHGGMKAVILTDSFQAFVLLSSLIVLMMMGQWLTPGGFSQIWEDSTSTNRIESLIWDSDLTIKHNVWSVIIGGTVYWLSMFCASQASIQKYLSVKSIGQVRTALWVSAVGLILIYCINAYMGAILYSQYKTCDPLTKHIIHGSDQMLPLYVLNVLGTYTGIPGFFVAGIFAASLGTVASAINSLAAVTMQDFLTNVLAVQIPENKGAVISKYLSILYGVISFLLIFIVERLGSVLQITLTFNGMVGGVILGLFTLGMFFPWANSKGALWGALVAICTLFWIGIGTQIAQSQGFDPAIQKPISIAGCDACFNSTWISDGATLTSEEVFFMYRISYLWYSCIGLVLTVVLGLAISICTGAQDPRLVDSDLQSPPLYHLWMSLSNDTKILLGLPIENAPNDVKTIGSIFATNLKQFSSRNQDDNIKY